MPKGKSVVELFQNWNVLTAEDNINMFDKKRNFYLFVYSFRNKDFEGKENLHFGNLQINSEKKLENADDFYGCRVLIQQELAKQNNFISVDGIVITNIIPLPV